MNEFNSSIIKIKDADIKINIMYTYKEIFDNTLLIFFLNY